jgi:hypothetical protein
MIVAAATVWVSPGHAADEVFERTVPLSAGGAFVLQNVNGSVMIAGWDRDAVEVRAVKTSPSASAQLAVSDLAQVQVNVTAAPGRVTVTTTYPKDEGVEVSVTYSVRVPRRVWLQQVATVNGTVRVTGVEGVGELRSVNGDVEVSDSAGPFSAHTTNGDIHMDLARLTAFPRAQVSRDAKPLRMETVNGSIVLALPEKTAASLEVRCLKGDFHSDQPVATLGAYTPREFQGRIGGGGTPVRLSTVNGAIRIQLLKEGI